MTKLKPCGFISSRALAVAFVSAVCAIGFSSAATADPEIVTESSGNYGPTVAGDSGLMAPPQCDSLQGLAPMVQTFHFIHKICDDRNINGLPRCDNRYTAYIEECSRPVTDEYTDFTIVSRKASGRYRICFNDGSLTAPVQTDCRDNSVGGGVTVIATGTTQTHTTHLSGTPLLQGISDLLLDKKGGNIKYFDLLLSSDKEQDWKKATGKRIVIHTTAQVNDGADCSGAPCGVASTGIGK